MEEINLYNLPKEMLIKLIMTIKDCKNLDDEQLLRNNQNCIQEMEERKTTRIKEKLLQNENSKKYINIIASIHIIGLKHQEGMSTAHLNTIFRHSLNIDLSGVSFLNGTNIIIYIGPNEICCNLYSTDQRRLCFLVGTYSVGWIHDIEEEYEIYVNFIHDILYHNLINLNYYVNAFVSVDSLK